MDIRSSFLKPQKTKTDIPSVKSGAGWAQVDAQGRIILPPDIAEQFGLLPGRKVRLDTEENLFRVHRPIEQLTRVYIEPTVACNLDCITCFRNNWEQTIGHMSEETFAAIFDNLRQLDPIPNVYFGGIGEPLFNPKTVGWIRKIKSLGVKVELIANGTMLTEKISRQLIDAGLDILWVSIDGASPESYADVRMGAELPTIIKNLKRFAKMRTANHFPKPEIGLAFVAMKRNIHDLPEVIKLGKSVKAKYYSVSNLQPATAELQNDLLYDQAIHNIAYLQAEHLPRLNLPKMDFNVLNKEALFDVFNSQLNINFAGSNWGGGNDVCSFVESGTMSIAWDGNVSPCWPLMHTHTTFLHGKPRLVKKHIAGNVNQHSLLDIWLDPEYLAYRERLHNFVFAPCTFCGGCDLSESNEEDCLGNNTFPVCGGCLWSQGVIQCP